jgi:hypothetical protein
MEATTIERNVDQSRIELPSGRSLSDFQRDAEYLAKHEQDLIAKYPNEWIAIYDSKVVAHSSQLRELKRLLRTKRLPLSTVVIEYLSRTPVTLIL